jgi:hypothetical protein
VYQWPPLEPIGGEWPTSQWPVNYWVQDKLRLPLGSDILAGSYQLRGVWLDEAGQAWLANTPEIGFELGPVVIEAQ